MFVIQSPLERQYESELQHEESVPFELHGTSLEMDLSGL